MIPMPFARIGHLITAVLRFLYVGIKSSTLLRWLCLLWRWCCFCSCWCLLLRRRLVEWLLPVDRNEPTELLYEWCFHEEDWCSWLLFPLRSDLSHRCSCSSLSSNPIDVDEDWNDSLLACRDCCCIGTLLLLLLLLLPVVNGGGGGGRGLLGAEIATAAAWRGDDKLVVEPYEDVRWEATVEASFVDSWANNNWPCYYYCYYCCQQSAVEKWANFEQWPLRLPNSPQMLSLRQSDCWICASVPVEALDCCYRNYWCYYYWEAFYLQRTLLVRAAAAAVDDVLLLLGCSL